MLVASCGEICHEFHELTPILRPLFVKIRVIRGTKRSTTLHGETIYIGGIIMSGILWFALLIPFLLIVILLSFPNLRKSTKWWELAIPIVVTVIVVFICQWWAIRSAINDKEYWGHMTYRIVHEEPAAYDGECSEQYACGTS